MPYVGQRLKRREDERLLQGRGAYVADVQRPDTLHLAVVRSPHAHARIRAIDVAAARGVPRRRRRRHLRRRAGAGAAIPLRMAERGQMHRYLQRPLARDKVRYVGEPGGGHRGRRPLPWPRTRCAHVQVEYEPLPALVDARAAAEPGAPLLFE